MDHHLIVRIAAIAPLEVDAMTKSMPLSQAAAQAERVAVAPAKINLVLSVLGKRTDGFHDIKSLAVAVGLHDQVKVSLAPPGHFELQCNWPDVPDGEDNLVVRAGRCLAQHAGIDSGARFELTKSIPMAAGLGGGSSDAAVSLQLLNELWQVRLSEGELMELAGTVGSDVPLFWCLPTARMSGRGEIVEQSTMSWSGWAVLVIAGYAVKTPDVYANWNPKDSDTSSDPAAIDEGAELAIDQVLRATSADEIMAVAVNHLEHAIEKVCPEVAELRTYLAGILGVPVRVTGAGSTMFTLFDDQESALQIQHMLIAQRMRAEVVGVGNNATLRS